MYGFMLSNVIIRAFKGELLTIYADGSEARSSCHVSDRVDGIIKIINGLLKRTKQKSLRV